MVFVRLAACDLRCTWCDTPYAFTGGRKQSIDDVIAEVARHGVTAVEITGGEPLLQPDVYPLMEQLIARGYRYKQIALRLGISPRTVESHTSAVLRKLQLTSRHELSRWATRRGLVDD